MAHELPPLPYDYAALEPHIDEKTMHLHHDMHHAAYVKNLNAALEKYPDLQSKSAEELLRNLNAIPEEIRAARLHRTGPLSWAEIISCARCWEAQVRCQSAYQSRRELITGGEQELSDILVGFADKSSDFSLGMANALSNAGVTNSAKVFAQRRLTDDRNPWQGLERAVGSR